VSMNAGIRPQCGRDDTFEEKVQSAADMTHAGTSAQRTRSDRKIYAVPSPT
jgi:hypothetical protein